MNTIIIRPIQPEDNTQIAAVIRQVFIDDDFPKTGTAFADAQLDFMFETYDKPKAIYFVVETEGKIIGGAGISQLENSKENICELQKMYFLQEARGKGIGFKMIEKCLEKVIFNKIISFSWMHTENIYAVAQKNYLYVYDNQVNFDESLNIAIFI